MFARHDKLLTVFSLLSPHLIPGDKTQGGVLRANFRAACEIAF